MIYLCCFAISSVFTYFASKTKDKVLKSILVFFSLIFPILLAGFRADTVGTDVKVYLNPIYTGALNSRNFNEYLSYNWFWIYRYRFVNDYEIGFTSVIYLVTKIFRSKSMVLITLQALNIIPIYYVCFKNKNILSPVVSMFVYFLTIYNWSLNLMRQCIAFSFVLLVINFALQKKYFRAIVFSFIAVLFHYSALFSLILIIFIYLFLYSNKIRIVESNSIFNWKIVLLSLGAIILLVANNFIAELLSSLGLHYGLYIAGSISISMAQIILKVPVFIYIFMYKKYIGFYKMDWKIFFIICVLDVVLNQFSSVNQFAGRISLYLFAFYILLAGNVSLNIKANFGKCSEEYYIHNFAILSYFVAYWGYYIFISNANETLPYLFA